MKPALLALIFAAFPGFGHAETPQSKPNILLILADDLGYSDLGCYGSEIATPNLDSLAANGIKFTQFYNTARCWPTRAALMTGYYAQQIRRDALPGNPKLGGANGKRPGWAVLLPKLLEPAGYRSYHTGKWHLDGMPIANGFDHSYYLKDQGRFFNPTKHWKDDKHLPPVEKNSGFYATTALADHVIEVLSDHDANYNAAPFFHYLAFAAPHFPLHALPEDIEIYQNTYNDGWDSIREQRWKRMQEMGLLTHTSLSATERELGPPYPFPNALKTLGDHEVNKPRFWNSLTARQQKFQSTKMAIHAAMIHRMDLEIGRIFDQIKKMGQWDNTLIIFLSDNGASAEIMVRDDGHDPSQPMGSADTYLCLGPGWSTTANTPFRRHKTWTHEGGISTPLLLSWPNEIKTKGETRQTPGHVIDIVPTLLQLAGPPPLPEAPPAPGRSLVPLFNQDHLDQHRSFWWFHDRHKAIREGKWKAVAPAEKPWELYDLSSDRAEAHDLSKSHPDQLNKLVEAWHQQAHAHREIATRDLKPSTPKRNQVLIRGEAFLLNEKHAFLMSPGKAAENASGKAWIFYAPTLNSYPDKAESWMHQKFLDAGIAIAGIDVGEAYGSPKAFPHFEALYRKMISRGYSKKPALLGRSRGGLWASSWALKHPNRVAGIGGIYPVYDFTTYPGTKNAAPAYGLTEQELIAQQAKLNPVNRAAELARAKIPVFIIHGTDDKVVPLAKNSAALEAAYHANGSKDLIKLLRIEGQGHNFWPGFFQCQELVDFLIAKAQEN
ncbi:sulfatase-like hydrolase/transferase [Verrucomicrobiaceae bacterium 227]